MAPPNTQLWRMADRLAGGQLAQRITDLRSRGLGHEQISRQLFADHGIEVTRQTIATWTATLDQPDPAEVA